MPTAAEYRTNAEALTAEWRRHLRAGVLPAFCTDPIGTGYAAASYLGGMVQRLVGDDTQAVANVGVPSASQMRWLAHGCPQFNLTASAAAAFVMTDTTGLRWGDIRLPFDDFVVFLPEPSPVVFDDYNHVVDGVHSVLVARCQTPAASNDAITDVFRRIDTARLAGQGPDAQRAPLAALAETPTLWVQGDGHKGGGIHRFYQKYTDPDQTLGDWCDPDVEGEWQSDRSRFAMSLVCRVVACLALYLDHSEGPARTWDPSLLDRNRARGKPTTWDIGREIKLPRELREAARLLGRSDRDPVPWAVESRKWVRGYWRNQPFGKGRAERRKQWIQPYAKGLDGAQVVPSLYKIGGA